MKRNIYLWALYDFANSIIMIVFLFYFSQWLVVDSHKPDWWFNATLIISSILFILTAPVIGQRLDITRRKLSGVRWTTAFMFITYLATSCVVLFAPSHVLLATILFTVALYLYVVSFIFYTPMLNDISDDSNRGYVSGLGQGFNYAGIVFGLLVTLPFATGALYLFGTAGRPQTLLPATILFGLFVLPMLFWFKESELLPILERVNIRNEYKKIFQTIRQILLNKNLVLLLLGYFLFSDALITFSNNFPLFLEKVYGASDTVKTYLTVGIFTLSIAGSIIIGKISDKKGSKRTLVWLLVVWSFLLPIVAFAPSFNIVMAACLIAGFFFGPIWGVSRAMVSELTHYSVEASSFSFYILAERFATLIGPITWSVVLASTASLGNISYSYAILSMGVLVIASFFFVRKIKPE
ncbi:MAG: MFS transporter [Patescibacteria group bacterium]|nr:MFS transporter [Patescibacteria group bacterium]